MNLYPRTIVCLTFSSSHHAALRCAGVLAKSFGSRLLVLDIVEGTKRSITSPGTPDYRIRRRECLSEWDAVLLEGANHECYELRGEPICGIRDFAMEHGADIVVVGNDSEFEGLAALGPWTRRIVESLPCAVMIVKTPIRETLASDDGAPTTEVTDEALEEEFPVSSWLLEHVNKTTDDLSIPA